MLEDDSIAQWYARLERGDDAAAAELFARYFPRLVGLARTKLSRLNRRAAADEEDVALSAFDSFCQRARRGDLEQIQNRDGLWRMLMTFTTRKAARLVRDQLRLKRGGGQLRGESVLDAPASEGTRDGIGQVAGNDIPPDIAAEMAEGFWRLLDILPDDSLRRVALWKLEGRTNQEISQLLGCALATVERRLALIRRTWETAAPSEDSC